MLDEAYYVEVNLEVAKSVRKEVWRKFVHAPSFKTLDYNYKLNAIDGLVAYFAIMLYCHGGC